MDLTPLWYGLALFGALVLLLAFVPVVAKVAQGNTSQAPVPAPAVVSPAPAPATTVASSTTTTTSVQWKSWTSGWKLVAGVIVLAMVLALAVTYRDYTVPILGIAALFALGVYLIAKHTGLARFAGWILVLSVVVFGPTVLMRWTNFIAWMWAESNAIADGKPIMTWDNSKPEKAKSERGRNDPPHQATVASEHDWTKPLWVPTSRCVRWWTPNPDADDLHVRVRGVNDPTWYDWNHFRQLKADGRAPFRNPAWFSFRGKGKAVTVHYQIGETRDSCT